LKWGNTPTGWALKRRYEVKLEDIGFYTLENNRAKNVSLKSPLWRCELLLTNKCNFQCPYCRGLENGIEQTFDIASRIIDLWAKEGLKNIRFSGGEPTCWKDLQKLIWYTKNSNIERIAVSTNGSRNIELYKDLIDCGVNDFSISLDACCASTGDIMSGIKGSWSKVVKNIEEISALTYVTVGIVLTEENFNELEKTIEFAYNLGVSDIRIISAAQWNNSEKFKNIKIKKEILDKCKILNYRITNFKSNRNVRGITISDNHYCPLVIDDMAIKGNYHYPCIIHLREGGKPIGKVDKNMRKERFQYYKNHNTFLDPICNNNCLDVCVDYNNKVRELNVI